MKRSPLLQFRSLLQETAEAWANVYLVICNSAVTVAVNVDVRFGAAFMFTDNSPDVAVVRDEDQGIVRIWRKPELGPPDGAMGRGSNGRCRIFVLLGCKAPDGVADGLDDKGAVDNDAIDNGVFGIACFLSVFKLSQRVFELAFEQLHLRSLPLFRRRTQVQV